MLDPMAKCRVFLAIFDRGLEALVAETLAPFGSVISVRPARRLRKERYRRHETDTFVVSPEFLQGFLDGAHPSLYPYFRHARVVLMLEREAVFRHARLMREVHGWVFVDDPMERLPEIIKLITSGHSIFPDPIEHSVPPDGVAPAGIERLTLEECVVLCELGHGRSVNSVAQRLAMSRLDAQERVASVLRKLGVGNRIEAGAIAVKHKQQIVRRRRGSIDTVTLAMTVLYWTFVSTSVVMMAIVQSAH